MNYKIIEASPEYADKYRLMSQRVFEAVYPNKERGLGKELFSVEVFSTDPVFLKWSKKLAQPTDTLKTWFAVDEDDEVVGGVVAEQIDGFVEMKAFYVDLPSQGKGIGRKLYEKVLEFADGQEIRLDVIEYADKTIGMYKRWGFRVDESLGTTTYPWVLWSKEAVEAYRGIFMVLPARQPSLVEES